MADPHVLTFEKDIENEIRSKSASLVDIAASSGVVQNKPEKKAGGWAVLVFILIFILCTGIIAFVAITIEQRKSNKEVPLEGKGVTTTIFEEEKNTVKDTFPTVGKPLTVPLDKFFPSSYPYLSNNLVKAGGLESAYIVTFTGYNTVFKTVLDNEDSFTKDLLLLYNTEATSTVPSFRDIKVGDLDARALISVDGKKIYYAFVKPSYIIIADSDTLLEQAAKTVSK